MIGRSGTVHPSDHFARLPRGRGSRARERRANSSPRSRSPMRSTAGWSTPSTPSARGWDAPVFSLPAVALAAGKLMKLAPEKLAQAVNLALNDHIPMGQTRTQTNSDWKGIADAEAGRNAVFAAMLARGGMTGPSPIFEGRKGFFQLVSTAGRCGRRRLRRPRHRVQDPSMRHESLSGRGLRPDRDRRRHRGCQGGRRSRPHCRDRHRNHAARL